VLRATEVDKAAHAARLAAIDKVSAGSLWKREEAPGESHQGAPAVAS
jgi:hypothetical protein